MALCFVFCRDYETLFTGFRFNKFFKVPAEIFVLWRMLLIEKFLSSSVPQCLHSVRLDLVSLNLSKSCKSVSQTPLKPRMSAFNIFCWKGRLMWWSIVFYTSLRWWWRRTKKLKGITACSELLLGSFSVIGSQIQCNPKAIAQTDHQGDFKMVSSLGFIIEMSVNQERSVRLLFVTRVISSRPQ
jgi:hypothetical protein